MFAGHLLFCSNPAALRSRSGKAAIISNLFEATVNRPQAVSWQRVHRAGSRLFDSGAPTCRSAVLGLVVTRRRQSFTLWAKLLRLPLRRELRTWGVVDRLSEGFECWRGSTINSLRDLQLAFISWFARSTTRYILGHYAHVHDVDEQPPSWKTGRLLRLTSEGVVTASPRMSVGLEFRAGAKGTLGRPGPGAPWPRPDIGPEGGRVPLVCASPVYVVLVVLRLPTGLCSLFRFRWCPRVSTATVSRRLGRAAQGSASRLHQTLLGTFCNRPGTRTTASVSCCPSGSRLRGRHCRRGLAILLVGLSVPRAARCRGQRGTAAATVTLATTGQGGGVGGRGHGAGWAAFRRTGI